jgi:DNA-binding protein H-NS
MADDQKGIALVEQRDKADLVEVVEKKVIAEKLRNAGIVTGKEKDKAEQKKLQAKIDLANSWRDRLLRVVRETAANTLLTDLMAASMAVIAHRFIIELGADRGGKVAGLWGAIGSDNYTRWEAIKLALPSMTAGDLLRFCLDCALIAEHKTDQYGYERDPECMIAVAEKLGLDAEALFQAEKEAQKAAEQAKKATKKGKKSKPVTSDDHLHPSEAAQARDLLREKNQGGATEAAPAGDETAKEGQELSSATADEGNEKPSRKPASFVVGDRVRIIEKMATDDLVEHVGKPGTVIQFENSITGPIPIYKLRFDDGAEVAAYDDEIEMYEEPTGPTTATASGDEMTVQDSSKRYSASLVKYRHPENAELCWSGRGRKPKWVEAWLAQDSTRTLADLEIKETTA